MEFNVEIDHFEVAVLGGLLLVVGPVLAALGSVALKTARRHDDDDALLLPHHAPKVAERPRQRTLRRDEGILLLVPVDVVGVDVVGAGILAGLDRQYHSTVVVT